MYCLRRYSTCAGLIGQCMQTVWSLWHKHSTELHTITKFWLPVAAAFLLNKLLSLTTLVLVGHLGPAQLAAAALGDSICNVTAISLL